MGLISLKKIISAFRALEETIAKSSKDNEVAILTSFIEFMSRDRFYVYVITNSINNKKYVGRTSDIEQRFQQHRSGLQSKTHINFLMQEDFNQVQKYV